MKRNQTTVTFLAFVLLSFMFSANLYGNSGGIINRTTGQSCGACHGNSSPNTIVTLTSSNGNFSVAPGNQITLTLIVAHNSKSAAGFNLAITDIAGNNAGTLLPIGSDIRAQNGELTHTAPKLMNNGSAAFQFTWTAPNSSGTYFARAAGNAVDNTGGTDNDEFNFLQNIPILFNVNGTIGTVTLLTPANSTTNVSTNPTLTWNHLSGARDYLFRISTSSTFTTVITSAVVSTNSFTIVNSLATQQQYYWNVRPSAVLSTGATSTTFSFSTGGIPTSLLQPTIISPVNAATGIPTNGTLSWQPVSAALEYEVTLSSSSAYTSPIVNITTSSTTVSYANLRFNTTYYWRVRAKHLTVLSAYRTATFVSLAAPPPLVVSPVTHAINVSSTGAILVWQAQTSGTIFEVQVSTVSTFSPILTSATTTNSQLSLPALQRNVQYFWRVRQNGTDMGTSPYTVSNFVTEVPRYATKLSVINVTSATVQKSNVPLTFLLRTRFGNAQGIDARISSNAQILTQNSNPNVSLTTILNGTTSTFMNRGASATTFTVTIRNITATAQTVPLTFSTTSPTLSTTSTSSWANLQITMGSVIVVPVVSLSSVVLVAPATNATNQSVRPIFTWTESEGRDNFLFQLSTVSSFSTTLISTSVVVSTFQSGISLDSGRTYFWRVRPENSFTTGNWTSNTFTVVNQQPAILAPTLLLPTQNATSQSRTSLQFVWSQVSNALNYVVEISTSPAFSTLFATSQTTQTSATFSNFQFTTTYYWRVRAISSNGTVSQNSAVFSFSTGSIQTQTIQLQTGWNLISSYVLPQDTDFASLCNGISQQIILARESNGGVYWPSYSINTISTWNYAKAYQVYATTNASLPISGEVASPNSLPLLLSSGWNWISYLRNTPQSADIAYAGISSLVIARDNTGNVYWPMFGINNLVLTPGRGYQLYVSSPATFTYQANSPRAQSSSLPNIFSQTAHYPQRKQPSEMFQTVLFDQVDGQEGDEIGVFSGDLLVGSGRISDGKSLVTIWSDDSQTPIKDGASVNEHLTIKLFNSKDKSEVERTVHSVYDIQKTVFVEQFEHIPNSMLVAKLDETTKQDSRLEYIFPNPAHKTVKITIPEEFSQSSIVFIISSRGEVVTSKEILQQQTVDFDVEQLPSGMYAVKFFDSQKGSMSTSTFTFVIVH